VGSTKKVDISKNYKNKILILSTVLFLFVLIISIIIPKLLFKTNIEKVLETISYSYLPKEAKNYIKEVYEESGEIILTEKNKKENLPYLNPKYVVYLSLSEEEKKEVYDIPESYTIDYVYESNATSTLPSKYDLRDVDGNNYITPMQNQGNLGLCWSFSTIEQVESYLMLKSKKSYNSATERFSVRQMDYATSTNGIINYSNENGYRELTTGGNFFIASEIMSNGLTLVNNQYMEYNENTKQKYLEDILNYDLSSYEVDSTVVIPNIRTDATEAQFNSYIDLIKSYVLEYGGAYVGTESPNYTCGSLNYDNTYLIRIDNSCIQNAGHAMQIIGWDDDYDYKYCKMGYYHTGDTSTCNESNLVTGKGAWILKNSWGTYEGYENLQYVYLAYDSLNSNIAFTTELSKMSERTWDNNYHENFFADNSGYTSTQDIASFNKIDSSSEKVEKVKFLAYAISGVYNVSIKSDNENYKNIKQVEVVFPGIYTIDLSNEDIIITDSDFDVIVTGINGSNLVTGTISAFTSTTDSEKVIETNDIVIPTRYDAKENEDYEFFIYSKTKNITSNDIIKFSLFDGDIDVTKYLDIVNEVSDNEVEVAKNDIYAHMVIDSKIGQGVYTLKMKHGEYESTSLITLGELLNVKGNGTVDSPYLITSESELKMMHTYSSSCFKLANDIELTEKWTPVGTEKSPFSGSFDGSGYTISGLVVDSDNYGGLFGYVSGNLNTTSTIKNLVIKDANVTSKTSSGILIGKTISKYVSSSYNGTVGSIDISNIHIIDGVVSSINGSSGSLVGEIELYSNNSISINNVFSSATIKGYLSSGLIGTLRNESTYAYEMSLNNILNVGNIDLREKNSDINYAGLIIGSVYYSVPNINNFIVTGNIYDKNNSDFNAIIGSVYDDASLYLASIDNGYYVNGIAPFKSIIETYPDYENKILKKKVTELKDYTLYKNWNEFNNNWSIPIVDEISRIPILNGVDFSYTKISDIILNVDSFINLYDYITPNNEASKNINYFIEDNLLFSIDENMNIKGLDIGESKIHIVSDYDGYEKDINIIVESKLHPEVHFYDNNGNNQEMVQITNKDESFILDENIFVKEGYKFVNWNTEKDGSGISYLNKETMDSLIDDITLYAQWEPISYKIIYNYNNEFDDIIKEVKYDEKITVMTNDNEKLSYSFEQWNTKSDGTGKSYNPNDVISNLTIIDGDVINLYAIWNKTSRIITFDSNTGSGTMENMILGYDEDIDLIKNNFAKEGYLFKEWNTNSDGSGETYLDTTKTSSLNGNDDITLYAQWMPITYTIYFDANYGDFSNLEQKLTYDKEETLLSNSYQKEGYKFSSWNTKRDGTGTSYYDNQSVINLSKTNEDVILLYAEWEPITYNILFDSNGGTGIMQNINAIYDTDILLSENKFIKNGYKFKEWNTSSDGTGFSYTDKSMVKNLTINENITLYAIWIEDFEYSIDKYICDTKNNYIDLIDANTSFEFFKNSIKVRKGYNLEIDLGNKTSIFTGSKTRIYNGNTLIIEFTNIVRGDINGDGKISSLDYVKVKNHIMKTNIINDSIHLTSADANTDNKISSLDYVRIKNIIMKGVNWWEI